MFQKSVNKAVLIGRLGGDPEVRYAPSGNAVANLNLATNRSYKNKEGAWENETTWHKIVVWGKLAELCKEHLKKGAQVYVEGRIQHRDWQDQNGQKRTSSEIVLDPYNGQIQMLESTQKGGGFEMNPKDEIDAKQAGESLDPTQDEDVPF